METKEEYIKKEISKYQKRLVVPSLAFNKFVNDKILELENLTDEEYSKIVERDIKKNEEIRIVCEDLDEQIREKLKKYNISLEEFDDMSEEEFDRYKQDKNKNI